MPELYWDAEIAYIDRDVEEVKRLLAQPPGNVWDAWPFGISVVGVATRLSPVVQVKMGLREGQEEPLAYMPVDIVDAWIDDLLAEQLNGTRLFTMNGTLFDYKLLAMITGRWGECTWLAQHSYDPCFQIWCMCGFPVGLEGCARYLGLPPKEMHGESAPLQWLLGNYDDVIHYVAGDAMRLKEIVAGIKKKHGVGWITRKGGLAFRELPQGFMTAAQCVEAYLRVALPRSVAREGLWWADVLGLSVGGK
ncbi:MAG: hypothetical protein KKD77_21750 [Gammaproteobacteria bacterium]|uniref:3'-5' exonuclease n=1 Tax=viral metagenome TaxID=1070528 RepID=A0A6M3L8H3_9ZZZZ|nr:hypothetical protein [Gammaproteobacteria bacterium]